MGSILRGINLPVMEPFMNQVIYLVGLVVVVMAVLSFVGIG